MILACFATLGGMTKSPGQRKRWKRWLFFASAVLLILALLTLGVLLLFEWRPEALMNTPIFGKGARAGESPDELKIVTWNIGYCGLGKEADFFMDGGAQVRPPDQYLVENNLEDVRIYLEHKPADIILLQEVDSDASRTFGIDQVAMITDGLGQHAYSRAINFKVPWIPYPIFDPIGKVESGLLSLSRFGFKSTRRHQLPGSYAWPVRVFHLKRCLHELRIAAPDGKDWVIIHLHLSAFDAGGRLRKEQMAYLKKLILELEAAGHHVVVGGDWNQAFPGLSEQAFEHQAEIPTWFQKMDPAWTPAGWQWAFDDSVPSLRATNKPYQPGQNFVTSVDGFLISPEVKILSVATVERGFTHSDHHPVHLSLSLKPEQPESNSKAAENKEPD
jgi:endonuclease/exonuclease/phosphatase family metal-dependent hydrolase